MMDLFKLLAGVLMAVYVIIILLAYFTDDNGR